MREFKLEGDEIRQIWFDFATGMQRWGLDRITATLYTVLQFLGRIHRADPLHVISGLRTQQEQRDLLRRWESGDRAGLAAKPARRSQHVKGKAFDVLTSNPDLEVYGAWAEELGGTWGMDWKDPGHFDTRKLT